MLLYAKIKKLSRSCLYFFLIRSQVDFSMLTYMSLNFLNMFLCFANTIDNITVIRYNNSSKGDENMTFIQIMQNKNISAYRLSKDSNVPYMTINDLINHKTTLPKCNAETIYKIAKALNTSVEKLIEPYMRARPAFELFKGDVCRKLKELGDIDFLADLLDNDEITEYYDLGWYPECLYLLAMLDYVSRINNVPQCSEYNQLRLMKLRSVVYPSSILVQDLATNSDKAKREAFENAIPEFKRFNIIENEVRNIV